MAEPRERPGRHPGFWEWVVPWRQAGPVQEEDSGTGAPRAPGSSPRGGAQSLHSTWAPATWARVGRVSDAPGVQVTALC